MRSARRGSSARTIRARRGTRFVAVTGQLPETPTERRVELHREFVFLTFLDVLAFMSDVADFADKANHHPRWENIFKTLRLYLTTWDIGRRISPLDIQLAQFFDRTYKRRHVDG